jgi:hypothetical protein
VRRPQKITTPSTCRMTTWPTSSWISKDMRCGKRGRSVRTH